MKREYDLKAIMAENRKRRERLRRRATHDPESGAGCCGPRLRRILPWCDRPLWLPTSMVRSAEYAGMHSEEDYLYLRQQHDFEFWAWRCATIHDKANGGYIPFVLNSPQRRVLTVIEADRLAGRPLRLILLKARQWGGSTLIQMYFAWIQCVLKRSWHSLICAHVKGTSAQIRGMYSRMLRNYPAEMWQGDEKPRLQPFEGMSGMRVIAGRDCQVTIASSFGGDSVRGLDYVLAHLSEVAFWKDSEMMKPEEFVRAVSGGIPLVPLSFVAIESTANGVGGFFHTEWLRAKAGLSALRPVFVAWHEIAAYRMRVRDHAALLASMDDYEWRLWDRGLTLEQIAWYHTKLADMPCRTAMNSEYPTDDTEAFAATGAGVFSPADIERLRAGCEELMPMRGDVTADAVSGPRALSHVRFTPSEAGLMEVWEPPAAGSQPRSRYVVAVDIGGRSEAADWSVITVIDRLGRPKPAVVAQWRGHCDHDLLGWRAAMTARWYADALLVVESNSLESAQEGASRYILEEIAEVYPNLYVREVRDTTSRTIERRFGFHTNQSTKSTVITYLIAAVREGMYTERSVRALNEYAVYEQRPNGSYGAKAGHHDDVLMTRAIGLYVASQLGFAATPAEPPRVVCSGTW